MADERKITELEGTVLGLIGVKGPCTPYVVRKEFQQSPTPFWNGSAGTIYPIIERLLRQGMVEEVFSENPDGRGGKLYVLTAKGVDILKEWLFQPGASSVVGTPPDPLRNRAEFLSFLAPAQRTELLMKLKIGLEAELEKMVKDSEKCRETDLFEYLSSRGAVLAARARLDWINEMSEILENESPRS